MFQNFQGIFKYFKVKYFIMHPELSDGTTYGTMTTVDGDESHDLAGLIPERVDSSDTGAIPYSTRYAMHERQFEVDAFR